MFKRRFATPATLFGLVCLLFGGAGCGNVDPALVDPSTLFDNVRVLRLQLPSLDEGLDGIRLWRRSESTGQFEPVSAVQLDGLVEDGGAEYLEYELMDPQGASLGLTLSAAVDRGSAAPELALWVVRFAEPGAFKASVYNSAGESPLSEQTILL